MTGAETTDRREISDETAEPTNLTTIADTTTETTETTTGTKGRLGQYLRVLIPVVGTAAVVLILMEFIFYVGYVPTGSMEPTIPTGSLIVGTRLYGNLNIGDVIVFRHDGKQLVKRIAAGPGDQINWADYPQTERDESVVTVPDNSWFVLGDNSEVSADARYWADPFIDSSDIIAKLFT